MSDFHRRLGRFYINVFLAYSDWAVGFDRWSYGRWDLWLGPLNIGGSHE